MAEETKNRSFRISDETTEKFRQLCSSFDNQNTALNALISAYEVQQAKAVITDRKTDISDYDTHLQALQKAFLHSLELNENAERRIRQEFQRQLESKDLTISDLQDSLRISAEAELTAREQAKNAIVEADERVEQATKEIEVLQKELNAVKKQSSELSESLTAVKSQIADKQQIIDNLNQQLTNAKEMTKKAESAVKVAEEVKELKQQLTTAEQAAKVAERIAEADKREALANQKEKYIEELDKLRQEIKTLTEENFNIKAKTSTKKSTKNSN